MSRLTDVLDYSSFIPLILATIVSASNFTRFVLLQLWKTEKIGKVFVIGVLVLQCFFHKLLWVLKDLICVHNYQAVCFRVQPSIIIAIIQNCKCTGRLFSTLVSGIKPISDRLSNGYTLSSCGGYALNYLRLLLTPLLIAMLVSL